MRFARLVFISLLGAAACTAPPQPPGRPQPASEGGTVTVRMSDFAFAPDSLRLRAGTPVRLRLVNESSGGHDFSAPAFFAASTYPAGAAAPTDGGVEVEAGRTVELTVIPRAPGTYPVECTHLLHAFFGMTASIEVVR